MDFCDKDSYQVAAVEMLITHRYLHKILPKEIPDVFKLGTVKFYQQINQQ